MIKITTRDGEVVFINPDYVVAIVRTGSRAGKVTRIEMVRGSYDTDEDADDLANRIRRGP